MELADALKRVRTGLMAGGMDSDSAWSLAGYIDCAFVLDRFRGRRLTKPEWAIAVKCFADKIQELQRQENAE